MNIDAQSFLTAMKYIGAGIAAIGCIGGGIGIGTVTGKAVEAIGRQPESASKVTPTMIMGLAFAEVTSLYALFVAIIILFVVK